MTSQTAIWGFRDRQAESAGGPNGLIFMFLFLFLSSLVFFGDSGFDHLKIFERNDPEIILILEINSSLWKILLNPSFFIPMLLQSLICRPLFGPNWILSFRFILLSVFTKTNKKSISSKIEYWVTTNPKGVVKFIVSLYTKYRNKCLQIT